MNLGKGQVHYGHRLVPGQVSNFAISTLLNVLFRKREEKMKKVQEMRELKKTQEKEQKMLLEKKLAEKRQLTCKLKEERIKEERHKHKLRWVIYDQLISVIIVVQGFFLQFWEGDLGPFRLEKFAW